MSTEVSAPAARSTPSAHHRRPDEQRLTGSEIALLGSAFVALGAALLSLLAI